MMKRMVAGIAVAVIASATPGAVARQPQVALQQETIRLRAQDGGRSFGIYHYAAGTRPKTAIIFMHPRGGNVTHFALEPLARNGFATLGMGSRSMNHTGIHEELLLDVAAAVAFVKSR